MIRFFAVTVGCFFIFVYALWASYCFAPKHEFLTLESGAIGLLSAIVWAYFVLRTINED